MENEESVRHHHSGRVVAGIIVILVGLAMLFDRTGLHSLDLSRHFWPFILIVIGLVRLSDPGTRDGRPRSRRSGAWLLFVGVWGLVNELHLFGLSYETSWPLLVIGAGLGVVWRAMDPQSAGGGRRVREN